MNTQFSLFDALVDDVSPSANPIPGITEIVGLKYERDFIDRKKHDDLLDINFLTQLLF